MEDEYEAQLRSEFDSCDSTSSGFLNRDEVKELCNKLQLDTHTHTVIHTLLHEHTQVSFEDFKDSLVSVLSCSCDFSDHSSDLEPVCPQEAQPKCVRGGKRYGRRWPPDAVLHSESSVSMSSAGVDNSSPAKVPRSSSVDSVESLKSEEDRVPKDLQWSGDGEEDGGIISEGCDEQQDVRFRLSESDQDKQIMLHDFKLGFHGSAPFSCSTPFRTADLYTGGTESVLTSTVGLKVLSRLDDGSGFTAPEKVLCVWTEEGIRNAVQILQSLDFPLDERLHLTDLTLALDNELLVGGSPVHQAALVSYRTEVQHLLDVCGEVCRQRDKLKCDLDQAEQRNVQLIRELDERQASMETLNQSRIRELQQDFRDRLTAQRCQAEQEGEELLKEVELQTHSLRVELTVLREKEAELQGELSSTTQECVRLQEEMLFMRDQLRHTQETGRKLQEELRQFDSLDPARAALSHEEQFTKILKDYELQCRELRDRNDELSSELELLRAQRKRHTTTTQLRRTSDSESDDSNMKRSSSPNSKNLQSDPTGLSIHTELMVEQLKLKHKEELQQLNIQLETQVNYYERSLELMRQNMEVERKDISQAFKLEISELEEQKCDSDLQVKRLKETVERLQKELQRSSSSSAWSTEQERRLQRERTDLEQSFAVELSHLVHSLSAEKEQLEAELQLRMDQEVLQVREELLHGGQTSMSEEELQCVMQERSSYARLCSQLSSQILEMEAELTALRGQPREERKELQLRLLQLEQLVLQLEDEDEPCRTQLEEVRGENSALQERLRLLQQEVQRLEEELHSRSCTLEELQVEQRSSLEETEQLRTETLRYREEVLTLSSRNLELSARLHIDQQEVQVMQVEQQQMVKRLQDSELQWRADLQEQQRHQSQLEMELQSTTSKVQNLEEERKRLQRDTQDRQCKIESLELSLTAMEKEAELLQTKLQSVNQDKVSHAHKVMELQDKLQKAEREVEQWKVEVFGLKQEKAELKQETSTLRVHNQLQVQKMTHTFQTKLTEEQMARKQNPGEEQLLLRLQEEQRKSQRMEEELRQQRQQNLKQEQYENSLSALQQRTEELESELKALRSVLHERALQLKEELNGNATLNSRLKEVMVNNSDLLVALQQTERRQKEAERRLFLLQDKNMALQRLLRDVIHAALDT